MARDKPLSIGCCICLNTSGERVTATTIIKGYAVCDQHRHLVSQRDFDIFSLTGVRRQV